MPHEFDAQFADIRNTAFPSLVKNIGTAIPVSGMAFDAATQENCFFRFRASGYSSGDVSVDIDWYADSATTGAVVWGAQLAAITPDTDTQDIETDALPSVTNVTDTHLGTTGQRLHRCTVTLTGVALDSIATNDNCVLCISRQAANGADTMTGDAILIAVSVAA